MGIKKSAKMITCLGVLIFYFISLPVVFGLTADDEAASELIRAIRTFEEGINNRDVDLSMSVLSPQVMIQAGAAARRAMFSWEEYRDRLVNWVKVVRNLDHFNFREVKIEGDRASLICDASLEGYSKKSDRWKPRMVLDVHYEFVRKNDKWYILKRTY